MRQNFKLFGMCLYWFPADSVGDFAVKATKMFLKPSLLSSAAWFSLCTSPQSWSRQSSSYCALKQHRNEASGSAPLPLPARRRSSEKYEASSRVNEQIYALLALTVLPSARYFQLRFAIAGPGKFVWIVCVLRVS